MDLTVEDAIAIHASEEIGRLHIVRSHAWLIGDHIEYQLGPAQGLCEGGVQLLHIDGKCLDIPWCGRRIIRSRRQDGGRQLLDRPETMYADDDHLVDLTGHIDLGS